MDLIDQNGERYIFDPKAHVMSAYCDLEKFFCETMDSIEKTSGSAEFSVPDDVELVVVFNEPVLMIIYRRSGELVTEVRVRKALWLMLATKGGEDSVSFHTSVGGEPDVYVPDIPLSQVVSIKVVEREKDDRQ